jgi:hypothetical protein
MLNWELSPDSKAPVPPRDYSSLTQEVTARMSVLETERYSWWLHWRELASYILPRRYKWLITPNQYNRGSPINQQIIDETGSIAARVLSAGMMSGITSPSRPWFRMELQQEELNDMAPVKLWCAEVAKRMQMVMAGSNYYTAKAMQFNDLAIFGTAPMLIYEDFDSVIRCFNPCAGEYYLANGPDFTVDTCYRKFTMTASQVAAEFGIENCSASVQALVNRTGASKDTEVIIAHAVEPNVDYTGGTGMSTSGVPNKFRYREVFWEWGVNQSAVLRIKGYYEQIGSFPRWDLVGNDPYGRSPAMDALPSIKQLQLESKRKAQALDKMVNPPMKASVGMKNQPASLLPGAVTYTQGPNDFFEPVYQFNPPIQEITQDIQDVRERIKGTFFNDLFMMISQLDTVRTATEIDARREEKLQQLGPVLERFQNEGLAPDIDRIFAIMQRNGLIPPAPPEIRGAPLKVVYDSMLSQMQRAAQTGSIERLWAQVGSLAGAVPDVLDLINWDEGVDEYADMLGVSPKLLNDPAKVAQMRQAKAQAAQQQAAMQQSLAAAQGAQTLSQTNVGGGQNALQSVLAGAGG